jgi:hypothetical protein
MRHLPMMGAALAMAAIGMAAAPPPGHLTREAPPRPKPPRPTVDLRPTAETKRARKAAKRLKLKGGEG